MSSALCHERDNIVRDSYIEFAAAAAAAEAMHDDFD